MRNVSKLFILVIKDCQLLDSLIMRKNYLNREIIFPESQEAKSLFFNMSSQSESEELSIKKRTFIKNNKNASITETTIHDTDFLLSKDLKNKLESDDVLFDYKNYNSRNQENTKYIVGTYESLDQNLDNNLYDSPVRDILV